MKVYILNKQQAERLKEANTNLVAFIPCCHPDLNDELTFISESDILSPIFQNHKAILDTFINEIQIADLTEYSM
jgi:hypothetical protein